MHFWIDKRSQAGYGGRSRPGLVAASLSRNDFYHPPRRNKSTLLPPHRPNVRTHRSHNVQQQRTQRNQQGHHQTARNQGAPIQAQVAPCRQPECQAIQQYPGHIAINMDQGALGMNAARTTNAILVETADDASDSSDVPGVPSFVRRGLWVSFALSVTFAAAFQHYWLIFVIFSSLSITFFSAACILSFRRSSRRPNIPATQLVTTSANEIEITHMDRTVPIAPDVPAPPPPYHIAIWNPKVDESPPPSYENINN